MRMSRRFYFIAALLFGSLCLFCSREKPDPLRPIVSAIIEDTSSFFYVDAFRYPKRDTGLPIGVFDSGTGGLTVLDAIVKFDQFNNADHTFFPDGDGIRDFTGESFIYLADQANMPYGIYSSEGKTDLLREHILKDVQFLLGSRYYRSADAAIHQSDKAAVKAIVIACNTATAYGKSDIDAFIDEADLDLKVIGVIDAGVRGALNQFAKDEDGSIGVLATVGTVASEGYVKALEKQKEALGITSDIDVVQQAGIGLAGAIDGSPDYIAPGATSCRSNYRGPSESFDEARIDLAILSRYPFDWDGGKMLFRDGQDRPEVVQINDVGNYIAYHVVSLLESIRKRPDARPLKTIILGCTHYPFYAGNFRRILRECYDYAEDDQYVYRPIMAEEITLIDPALNTARELYEYLLSTSLFNTAGGTGSEFYVSVPNVMNENNRLDAQSQFPYDFKYGRRAGEVQEYVKRVPFSRRTLSLDVISRLEGQIPLIYDLIRQFNHENPKTAFLLDSERIR